MTESPREQHDVPPEEHISPSQADEQLDTDPASVPNAPNRDPSAASAGNNPEAADPDANDRDDRDDDADPTLGATDSDDLLDQPNRDPRGPDALDPGVGTEPDTRSGTESFERPGEESNWQQEGRNG